MITTDGPVIEYVYQRKVIPGTLYKDRKKPFGICPRVSAWKNMKEGEKETHDTISLRDLQDVSE